MGAFFPSKCSYRSKWWTGGRVLPLKVLLPVQMVDRRAHLSLLYCVLLLFFTFF